MRSGGQPSWRLPYLLAVCVVRLVFATVFRHAPPSFPALSRLNSASITAAYERRSDRAHRSITTNACEDLRAGGSRAVGAGSSAVANSRFNLRNRFSKSS
jgi:hypothetical protein